MNLTIRVLMCALLVFVIVTPFTSGIPVCEPDCYGYCWGEQTFNFEDHRTVLCGACFGGLDFYCWERCVQYVSWGDECWLTVAQESYCDILC